MKTIELFNNKNTYGIYYISNNNLIEIKDYFPDKLIKIPFGETLFYIINSIDILQKRNTEKLREYFADKRYDLSDLLTSFEINSIEINNLIEIKKYITLCADKPEYCSINNLHSLASKIFEPHNELFSLFSSVGSLRLRKYKSSFKLPFATSTNRLTEILNNQYSEYQFYTSTPYNSISELCVITLYEIFNLNLLIKRCKLCSHYFVSNRLTKYCSRELLENDFQGCKKYKIYLTNKIFAGDDLIKKYKKVYNRLYFRAKKNRIKDITLFEEFKNEWSRINKHTQDNSSKRILLEKYLDDERWI